MYTMVAASPPSKRMFFSKTTVARPELVDPFYVEIDVLVSQIGKSGLVVPESLLETVLAAVRASVVLRRNF